MNYHTLGQCLHTTMQRVRPAATLYLFLGNVGWVSSEEAYRLVSVSRMLELDWDAYITAEAGQSGIFLYGPDGKGYCAFEIEKMPQTEPLSRGAASGPRTMPIPLEPQLLISSLSITNGTIMSIEQIALDVAKGKAEEYVWKARGTGKSQSLEWAIGSIGGHIGIALHKAGYTFDALDQVKREQIALAALNAAEYIAF